MENNSQYQEQMQGAATGAIRTGGKIFVATRKVQDLAKGIKKIKDTKKVAAVSGKVISSIAATAASGAFAAFAIPMLIFVILIMIVAPSSWFGKESETEAIRKQTATAIKYAYSSSETLAFKNVAEYLNEKYACDYKVYYYSIIAEEENGVSISLPGYAGSYTTTVWGAGNGYIKQETDTTMCNVKLNFTTSYEEAINDINAYGAAVNGTLSSIGNGLLSEEGEEKFKGTKSSNIPKPENPEEDIINYIEADQETKESKLEETKRVVDSAGNEFDTQLNKAFKESLYTNADELFFTQNDAQSWDMQLDYQPDKVVGYEQKEVCDKQTKKVCMLKDDNDICIKEKEVACGLDDEGCTCVSSHLEDDETKPIKKDVLEGTVTVPMYYDVSYYKKEQLDELNELYAQKEEITIAEAQAEINEVLYNQYQQYFESYGLEMPLGSGFAGVDPIYFEAGAPGWDGTLSGFYGSSANPSQVKARIIELFNVQGQIQCVHVTNAYLKDTYGIIASGNGKDIVPNLVNEQGWTLLSSPAPGAIFSTSGTADNMFGHTGVVIAVNGSNIVVLEGNVNPYLLKDGTRNPNWIAVRTKSINVANHTYSGGRIIYAIKS